MTIPSRSREWVGVAVGAAGLLAALLMVLHDQKNADPVEKLALKYKRIGVVQRMQSTLATATEAEKSAVMAITDEESQHFADRARAASAAVDSLGTELAQLLAAGGTQVESDLLAQFSQVFAEFKKIDQDLLVLAAQNTNLKAYGLAFGPAAETIDAMHQALARILAQEAHSTSSASKQALLLAATADAGALRIQACLAPHIAAESAAKMDSLEASMGTEDQRVRNALQRLAPLVDRTGEADLRQAAASYARFGETRTRILELSRQNSNVRSLSVSLNEKRRATVKCQDALAALEQAIQSEPASERTPVNPRKL